MNRLNQLNTDPGSPGIVRPQTSTVRTSAYRAWLGLAVGLALAGSAHAAEFTYVKVGNPVQTGSSVQAMDNRGRVATTSLIRSFLFADNFFVNYVEITNVNVATSTPGMVAQGLNDLGEVVGRFRTNGAPANQTRGFIRRADGTLEPFDYPGVASTSISEINNHGHLVGETRSDLTSFGLIRGFVHTNGVSAEVHFPGATLTRAYGINDAGDIVGQYQLQDAVSRPFLLRNGGYSQIVPTNAPGGLASAIAFSISDSGLVLGTYRDLANVSKTWVMRTDGTFEYPVLPGAGRVINSGGQIAGSFTDTNNANASTPYVATPKADINFTAHRLALTNSARDTAAKINNAGQITGTVDGTDGVSRGYRFDTATGQQVERAGYPGSDYTEWGGINSAGTLAGYYADPADPTFNTYRAFVRDSSGAYTAINWPGDPNFGFTVDIDEHGRVAGGGNNTAWVWNTNGTFNVFNVPGFQVNGAFGMNDYGIVVGVAWPGFFDTPNGLIYNISNNTATIWNYPGAAQTTLYGINNRGDIVGEFKPNLTSANIPFVRWADGTTQVLTFPGLASVRVYDINDARVVVGRYEDAANKNRSFYATPLAPLPEPLAFTFEPFDIAGAASTLLSDIRNDGALVGRYIDGGGISQGFVQKGTNFTAFNVTGTTATFPGGMDNFGRIAGFYRNATNPTVQHGFIRETNGTFTTIDGPGQTFTYAWRINDAGQVNGYWFEDPFFITAFRRATNGTLTTNLFTGSPLGTVTRGMNEAGDTAGWKWDANFTLQGVVFAGGQTNVFTVAGWEHTLPGDINNLGDIAGTVNNGFTNTAGFFRRADGATVTFNPPGAVEVEVFGLNDLGQVVGEYADASGRRHGFIARPALGVATGHVDIGIGFENGAFDLHIHDESREVEFAPGGAVLQVGTAAEQVIPDTVASSFLGRPGYSTWILPATHNEQLLFLGLGAEEIGSGVFVNNSLRLELVEVVGGDLALFTLDFGGNPTVHMNSADGISTADHLLLSAGSHQHVNWAFSAPGTYRVSLRVRGTLVAGNHEVLSETAYYTFKVPAALLAQPRERNDSIAYKFSPLDVPGAAETYLGGVNEAGQLAGTAVTFTNNFVIYEAFVQATNGTISRFSLPGGHPPLVQDLNNSGLLSGYYPVETGLGALDGFGFTITTSNGVAVGYRFPTNGAFSDTAVHVASDDGRKLVGAYDITGNGDYRGFIFDPVTNGFTRLDGTNLSAKVLPYGMNASGVIVGSHDERGFILANGQYALHQFKGQRTRFSDINTAGVVVGYAWDGVRESSFVFRDGFFEELALPGAVFTRANAINDAGVIVGEYAGLDGRVRGFVATPATRLKRGHTDIGIAFEEGAFDLHVHDETINREFAPADAVLSATPLAQTRVPTNAAYAFLGSPGAPVWILPQTQNPKLLYLGIGAEEIGTNVFVNDTLKLTLTGVDGPGQFALYGVTGFGQPNVRFNTRDGIDATDSVTVTAGSHEHFNWAFGAPGVYRVRMKVSGTLIAGNRFVESDEVEYCFEVVGIETRIGIARNGGVTTLPFLTQDGLTYQLESAAHATGPWLNEGAAFLGTGREKNLIITPGGAAQFYRVRAVGGN
jgi:surface-anchored protein